GAIGPLQFLDSAQSRRSPKYKRTLNSPHPSGEDGLLLQRERPVGELLLKKADADTHLGRMTQAYCAGGPDVGGLRILLTNGGQTPGEKVVMHIPPRCQHDAVTIDRPSAHDLGVVGRKSSGDFDLLLTVGPDQAPHAEGLIAIAQY